MISEQLSHVDAAQAALLDIERRRLSTVDMYQHALVSMAARLDRLVRDLSDSSMIGNGAIIATLDALLQRVFNAVTPQTQRTHNVRDRLSTRDTDLKLIAYSTLRDGISEMYRNHHGRSHDRECLTCVALWECAGMIAAVDRINTGRMAVARQQIKTVHKGQLSHRSSVQPRQSGDVTTWLVTCPTCGPLGAYPLNNFQAASTANIKHRRASAALNARTVKPT